MGKVKRIVDGVVVEVDDSQIVKTIENGVVVEKPLQSLKKKDGTALSMAGAKATPIGGEVGSSNPQSEKDKVLEYLKIGKPAVTVTAPSVKEAESVSAVLKNKGIPESKGAVVEAKIKKDESPFDISTNDEFLRASDKLNEVMYGEGDDWVDPVKAHLKNSKNATNLQDALDNIKAIEVVGMNLAPSGYYADKVLKNSIWSQASGDNLTANMLRQKADDYQKRTAAFQGIQKSESDTGSGNANKEFYNYVYGQQIDNAAIKSYAEKNPNFKEQLQAAGIDLNDPQLSDRIGSAKAGQIISESIFDPEVIEYAKNEAPWLLPALKSKASTLITDYKDFGINLVANKVSRAIQESGYNNIDPIFNFANDNIKEFARSTAKLELTPEEYAVYEENILGNEEKYLDTPSFFEGFASAGKSMLSGAKSTLTTPFKSVPETIREGWEKEATNVSADPKGLMKVIRDSGHAVGIVSSLAAMGNVLGGGGTGFYSTKVVPALSGAIPFMGDFIEEGTMKYPNNPVKAWTSALFNTAMYSALSYKIFPVKDVQNAFKNIKTEVAEIVENLASGRITREVARQQMSTVAKKGFDLLTGSVAKSAKISAELTGITALNSMLDKVMGMSGDTFEKYHPEGEEADAFTSLFLSNLVVGGMAKFGEMKRGNRIVEQSLYAAASNPKRFQDIIDKMEVKDPTINKQEMLDNLTYLTQVKDGLDKTGIDPKNQARYLFEAMKEKVQADAIKSTPDANITRMGESKINESRKIKDRILEGEDVVGEEQAEVEKEVSKESETTEQVLNKAVEDGYIEGAYADMVKAGQGEQVLKEISQQAQNITADGEPHNKEFADIARKSAEQQVGKKIVALAIEKYPIESFKKGEPEQISQPIELSPELPEVYKLPQPKVAISEMNSEQLIKYSEEISNYLKNQEVKFFGEEGAKKYKEARRVSNSVTASTSDVKEADRIMKEMEDSLSQEQRDAFFGINQPKGIYDPSEIRDLATRVRLVEESESASDLGGALKLPLLEFNRNSNNESALAVLNAAKKKAEELKLDPKSVFAEAIKRISKDIPDRNDQIDLAASIFERLLQPKTEENAIQIGSTEKTNVGETPGDSAKVGEGVSQPKEPAGTRTQEEGKIEGEEGLAEPPKTPPPTEKVVTESGEDFDGRRFTKQMLRSEEISDVAKEEIAKTLDYARQTNEMTVNEASDVIKRVGLDEAQNLVMNDRDLKPAVRVTVGMTLIKRYNELANVAMETGSEAHRDYYLDKAIQTATFVTEKLATEPGQMIQAFSMWSRLSPEGQLRAANQDMARQGKEKLRKRKKDIDVISTKFKKANEETAEEISKSEAVKKSTQKVESKTVARAKDKIAAAKKKREQIIKKYKSEKGKNLYAGVGLTKEGIEFVGDLVKTYVQEGVAKLEIIVDKVLEDLKNVTGKDTNDEVRKNVYDIVKDRIDRDANVKIEKELKEIEKKVSEIVKKHYTVSEKEKKSLVDKFVEQVGLDKEEASELAKEIETEFDKIATRKKRNILYNEKARFDKINNSLKGDKSPEKKTVADEIIKYSNLGAFENNDFADLIAKKFGLGEISPEQAAKLMELAKKVENAPEGSPKNSATEDLLSYRAKLRGNDLGDTALSVYYANILSGYKTHEKNLISTFFQSMGEIATEMVKDPKSIPYLIAGYLNGVGRRGVTEARHTFATGKSPIHIRKIETPNVLERKSFIGGKFNPANWFKYITRLMVAEDVLSFQGLKEARARQLARRVASSEGFNTWSKNGWDRVNEILFHTKELWKQADEQATEEGLSGVQKRRRIYELMENNRPLEMTEDAYGFAARGTFNHLSEGTLGAITNAVASGLDSVSVKGFKPGRIIIPFTRIITNVVNNTLDYSPIGLIRAARGVRGFKAFEENSVTKSAYKELSKEERQRLIAKAAIGITVTAALQAMHMAGVISISGAGPDDPKKKAQLMQEGWQPYSIKIGGKWYSYQYTPLVFMTGFLGNMNDAGEYNESEDSDTFIKRMEVAASRLGGQVVDMTWINSASTFLGALAEPNPSEQGRKVSQSLAGMARGFIPFSGAVTQFTQAAEKIWKMPQKQVNNAWQALVADIPIARNSLNDKINALGDPIVKDIDVIVSSETVDPVWKYLLDKKGWVAPVNKGTIVIYDEKDKMYRPVTNDEYYDFSKLRGRKIKSAIEDIMKNGVDIIDESDNIVHKTAEELTPKQLNVKLTEIEEDATKGAKKELFAPNPEKTIERKISEKLLNIGKKISKY